jgi:hypothetical protein
MQNNFQPAGKNSAGFLSGKFAVIREFYFSRLTRWTAGSTVTSLRNATFWKISAL